MKIRNAILTLGTAVLMAVPGFGATAESHDAGKTGLETKVRQAINTLSNYSVFDDIHFKVDDRGVVTLEGQVRTYVVRNQAMSALKNVEGVTSVKDEIEVLPLSRYDDDIRVRAFYAIFGDPTMTRYLNRSISPIRILVKNGDITIAGVVQNEFDRKLVTARVRSLPYAFKVTNALTLDE